MSSSTVKYLKEFVFEDTVSIITDFTANGSFEALRNNVKYYYEPNFARLIRLTDLRQGLKNDGVYVDPTGYEYLKKSSLMQDDLLLANVGEYTGYVCLMPELEVPSTLAPNMFLIRFDSSIDSKFMFYLMSGDEFTRAVDCISASSATKLLNKTNLRKIAVKIPALSKQQKTAKILNTVDNLIDQTQSLIDKYTDVKQGMMADLFSRGIDLSGTPETNKNYGQLRPSYENAPELYQETELGWVPKGWDVHPVENVAIGGFKNGYFKDPKLVGSGKKLINVTELYQDFGIDITTDKVERVIVSPKDFEKYKVDIGDLFFTRSSLVLEGIAKSNIVRNLPEEAVFECHVMRLKPNKEVVVPEFLALFTGMPKARSYLMSMAKQVTMTTIAQPDMVGLPTPVPSLNEQQAIVEKIDAIDELIRKEKETVEKNKNIKKGLMQDLLTGKVKVI